MFNYIKISVWFIPKCDSQYVSIGSDNGLAPNRRQLSEPMMAQAYMRHLAQWDKKAFGYLDANAV